MKFNKLCVAVLTAVLAFGLGSCAQKEQHAYQTVENDPMNARIYTLPNGLKVYMTVNKEQPRIQTYIAVRTGGKNDPSETTGLAHYLEHLMFKGTTNFGTQNYEAEKPLLDEITVLYESYRTKTDEAERKAIYHKIDSISGLAAKYAIPNEYDKLMSVIGASGTNAYTSEDVTCYIEDIPNNQIENWARIEAERFMNPVFRLFHTELEAVYEEKNISMTNDFRKELEAMNQTLFPTHPYGKQTVIGTQEHLKNPSLINIRNYFDTWYVPNNVAICMSGDFDPDQAIATIVKYFGGWKPSAGVPHNVWPAQRDLTEPVEREVFGQEAENVMMAWRMEGSGTENGEMMSFLSGLLYNGTAGLLDLDLNLAQRVQFSQAFFNGNADYSSFVMLGMPLPGQSLSQLRDVLLEEVAKLRNGDFDEELIQSLLTDYKVSMQKLLEANDNRADMFVQSFVNDEPWEHVVSTMDRLSKITKQDVVDFANKFLRDDNYVCIYKRQGEDQNIQRIEKPAITPVEANRDAVSPFVQSVIDSKVDPIHPVFVDFQKDMQRSTLDHGQELLYKHNETNGIFELFYQFEMGQYADRVLPYVSSYVDYIGTSDMTPDQIQKALYKLGCSMSITCSSRRFYARISGLNENLEAAVKLLDKVLNDAQPDDQIYSQYLDVIEKERIDNKANQNAVFRAVRNYTAYGPDLLKSTVLSSKELRAMKASDLTDRLHNMANYKHRVMYYGPSSVKEVAAIINENHTTAKELKDCPVNVVCPMVKTDETSVNFVSYVANNSMMGKLYNLDKPFDLTLEPSVSLYNEYFGGSMNSIVFQEMRETRGLAYSAWANLSSPSYLDGRYNNYAMIVTQTDKLEEAYKHFDEIIDQMPESESAFQNAKTALVSRMRSERTTRSNVLWAYINATDLGLNEDPSRYIFEKVQNLTLADLIAFQQKNIKGGKYKISLVGDPAQVDMKFFESLGKVNKLTLEDVFGY